MTPILSSHTAVYRGFTHIFLYQLQLIRRNSKVHQVGVTGKQSNRQAIVLKAICVFDITSN